MNICFIGILIAFPFIIPDTMSTPQTFSQPAAVMRNAGRQSAFHVFPFPYPLPS